MGMHKQEQNSQPSGIWFCDLWISGPENNHCASATKVTDVAMEET